MAIKHFERITESILLPPWLAHEHQARYEFCRQFVAGKTVLDCGSGEGKGSREIAEGRPRAMIALDRAINAVTLARTATVQPLAASAEQLPLRNRAADVIVALEVIEHLDDPDAFIADVVRSLASNGTFICSTPNRLVRNPLLPLDGKPLNPWHLREWTAEEFHAILSAGFESIEMFGQVPQSPSATRWFERVARVWRRGAAILRQLVKFRLLLWRPRGLYAVQKFHSEMHFEFMVCVCTKPRRAVDS